MKRNHIYKFIFAGGGTGGHLYPALAVAEKIRELKPESEILFVGVKNKIEARVVPTYGFKFKTIWISGFARKMNLSNLLFPLKVLVSYIQSLFININFNPRVAIGSGAYVAGPVISSASTLGSKVILLEQNSYPGITNRLLEKKADEIHVAFEESTQHFREKRKIKITGNPVRTNLKLTDKEEAKNKFGLDATKKTLMILGGSGGAKTINQAVANNIQNFTNVDVQIIWQTGELYYENYKKHDSETVKVKPFISDMSSAYSSADLILARSGATTIAEVANLGLPVIFVPSPNVAANHQLKNAEAFSKSEAAEFIEDQKLNEEIFDKVNSLINDIQKLDKYKENIKKFSKPDAANDIAQRAIQLAETL